jgi:hypothetical protein
MLLDHLSAFRFRLGRRICLSWLFLLNPSYRKFFFQLSLMPPNGVRSHQWRRHDLEDLDVFHAVAFNLICVRTRLAFRQQGGGAFLECRKFGFFAEISAENPSPWLLLPPIVLR